MIQVRNFLSFVPRWQINLVCLSVVMIILHLFLKIRTYPSFESVQVENFPLLLVIFGGGVPLLGQILLKVVRRDFGADVLAAIAVVTAVILDQYLAATLIILMLATGQALETYALGKASSVLKALADRMPTQAHLKEGEQLRQVNLADIRIGDHIFVFPHEICPIDGIVYEGHGSMDESYLTGEPYQVQKAPGATVLSGSVNGNTLLVIKTEKLPSDSRYRKIMEVMTESQQKRPTIRRLGDQLGAIFIPVSLLCAGIVWGITGDPMRFLSVLVIATPCPLLIAIPITVMSAISIAARRGIIIKDPVALERLPTCRTAIFDKTGTLTYGKPTLTALFPAPGFTEDRLLQLATSLERYSRHPLAQALMKAGENPKIVLQEAKNVSEKPGHGLTGIIEEQKVHITHRTHLLQKSPMSEKLLPPVNPGMECILMVDDQYAGAFQFRDVPRKEGLPFISHLGHAHKFRRILLLSGDKASEVKHLAALLGIHETLSSQSPEQKLEIVRQEVAKAPTLFVGDGINDAPALTLATVGIAFGKENQIAAEAASVVVMDTALIKIEELIHISYSMRKIALQSAVGGMVLSFIGMGFAAAELISPIAGALIQEGIDVLAIFNALRLTFGPKVQIDMKV